MQPLFHAGAQPPGEGSRHAMTEKTHTAANPRPLCMRCGIAESNLSGAVAVRSGQRRRHPAICTFQDRALEILNGFAATKPMRACRQAQCHGEGELRDE
eukprot:scaffold68728_cov32-Tisochrysis_lutea.AAC.1